MQRMNSHHATASDAERCFPVRIRVARDRLGRDRQYENMCRWLDTGIGPNRWWHADERLPAHPDTFLFYFVAIADAQAFIDRFSCGVWISGEWPHNHAARTDESDMGWVGEMQKT